MCVPRNVGVRMDGRCRKLDDLEEGGYANATLPEDRSHSR